MMNEDNSITADQKFALEQQKLDLQAQQFEESLQKDKEKLELEKKKHEDDVALKNMALRQRNATGK